MSVISAGTTTTTAFKVTGDTTGTLQLQTGAVPTTAINISATQVVTFPATTTLDFTGSLLLGDGSATAPTLAHSGDTNTGMFFPAADTIAFTEGGVESMRLTSAGNLGIGTNNPVAFSNQTSVTVNGTNNGRFDIRVGGTHTAAFVGGGSAVELSAITSVPMTFATNSVERMRLDASGNLGLGVTPVTQNGGRIVEVGTANGNIFRGGGLNDTNVESNIYFNSGFKYAGNGFGSRYSQNSGVHQWWIAPNNTSGAGANATLTQAMTLDASGRLVVGGTTATQNLTVASGYADLNGVRIGVDNNNDIYRNGSLFLSVADTLIFKTGGALSERARITSGGNLGLGTASPTAISNYVAQTINGTSGSFTEYQQNGSNTFRVGSDISDGGFLFTQGATAVRFGTSGVERARITSGGELCINRTSGLSALLSITSASGNGSINCGDAADGTAYGIVQITRPADQPDNKFHLSFIRSGHRVAGMGFLDNSNTFAIQNDGSNAGSGVTLTSSATSWGSTSDEREKNILGNVENAADKLASWRSVYYRYKIDKDDAPQRIGLIAQDVQATVPEAISVGDDEAGTLQLRYSEVIPVLVKAIQELSAKVAALESK